MSTFANWLFTLLLGWTKILINGVFSLIFDSQKSIGVFFQVFWLPFLIAILLFGTAFDYIIWIIRWRPHYVWRSHFMLWKQKKERKRQGSKQVPQNSYQESNLQYETTPYVSSEHVDIPINPPYLQDSHSVMNNPPQNAEDVYQVEGQFQYLEPVYQNPDSSQYMFPVNDHNDSARYDADAPAEYNAFVSQGTDYIQNLDPFYQDQGAIQNTDSDLNSIETSGLPLRPRRQTRVERRKQEQSLNHLFKKTVSFFNDDDRDKAINTDPKDTYHIPYRPSTYHYDERTQDSSKPGDQA